MNGVIAVIVIALLEYMFFSFNVGMARAKFKVDAPAISGHPEFERYFRVQQNTLEQLIIFIPAILVFSFSAENIAWPGYAIATGLGAIWIVGRFLYFRSYVKNPSTRLLGFLMTFFPNVVLLVGTLVCLIMALL